MEVGEGPERQPAGDLAGALEGDVRAVLRALRGTNVEEIRLDWGDVRIVLRRDLDAALGATAPAGEAGAPLLSEPAPPAVTQVVAQTVGPFHRSREPDGPALAGEGDRVEAGRPIGVIETLGMATDLEAPSSGVLERFLVEDGQAVEFGQVVATISPDAADT